MVRIAESKFSDLLGLVCPSGCVRSAGSLSIWRRRVIRSGVGPSKAVFGLVLN